MSRISIIGTIENIKSRSNVYTPIIEAIVNSIESIVDSGEKGKIEIILQRERQLSLEDELPNVNSIIIYDEGEGFNLKNRDSFDTFYSREKKERGGKGFGRFMFVKYFEDVSVKSVFKEENKYKRRSFNFGKNYNIIENEEVELATEKKTYSKIFLKNLKKKYSFDKSIDTIARKILDKILIFFTRDDFECPTIIIKEEDNSSKIVLNDYLEEKKEIQVSAEKEFILLENSKIEHSFKVKLAKVFYPGTQKSRIILTANNRAVTETNLSKYVPEFEGEFYEETEKEGKLKKRNYIIRAYVISEYLDKNVSLEREGFEFQKEEDLYHPFSQTKIEEKASAKAREEFNKDISIRAEKKTKRIKEYVRDEAPWHKPYLNELDLSSIPLNIKTEEIEAELQKIKFKKEQTTKSELQRILSSKDEKNIGEAIAKISEIGKSDLAHYVFNRKYILEFFKDLLKRRDDGKANLEADIHNLIFPMGKDSVTMDYHDHNLWLIDERLVFSEYIASDMKIGKSKGALKEPDLVIFDEKNSFRGGENEFSNPLTIFEFKRPKRTDYADKDDPIVQIGEYLDKIKEGKYEMPDGLEKIKVNDNTPVYGYIICDITEKIITFAKRHQLVESPDREGYYGYHSGFKMYIEIVSFKKLLQSATLRNKIFFKKLQI